MLMASFNNYIYLVLEYRNAVDFCMLIFFIQQLVILYQLYFLHNGFYLGIWIVLLLANFYTFYVFFFIFIGKRMNRINNSRQLYLILIITWCFSITVMNFYNWFSYVKLTLKSRQINPKNKNKQTPNLNLNMLYILHCWAWSDNIFLRIFPSNVPSLYFLEAK